MIIRGYTFIGRGIMTRSLNASSVPIPLDLGEGLIGTRMSVGILYPIVTRKEKILSGRSSVERWVLSKAQSVRHWCQGATVGMFSAELSPV